MHNKQYIQLSPGFFIRPEFKEAFEKLELTDIDAVFAFTGGQKLTKTRLPEHRTRIKFNIDSPATTLFLKRYDSPGAFGQLRNWLAHHNRKSSMYYDLKPAEKLAAAGINTPKTICFGQNWNTIFEKRSFIITENINNAEALERKLPRCFSAPAAAENLKQRKNFIARLGSFARKFHNTGYRHRDFYLAHIFYCDNEKFYLIDLHRTFKPIFSACRFQIKDISQLYYSALGTVFSRTDRLRFYLSYMKIKKLSRKDKIFIRRVIRKANRMAGHDKKHGRDVPFAN